MRIDGLLALHSLAILACGNQDIEEKLRAEPAWQGLFSANNSALLSIDVAAKQNDQDACLIVKLCQHLLLHVSYPPALRSCPFHIYVRSKCSLPPYHGQWQAMLNSSPLTVDRVQPHPSTPELTRSSVVIRLVPSFCHKMYSPPDAYCLPSSAYLLALLYYGSQCFMLCH